MMKNDGKPHSIANAALDAGTLICKDLLFQEWLAFEDSANNAAISHARETLLSEMEKIQRAREWAARSVALPAVTANHGEWSDLLAHAHNPTNFQLDCGHPSEQQQSRSTCSTGTNQCTNVAVQVKCLPIPSPPNKRGMAWLKTSCTTTVSMRSFTLPYGHKMKSPVGSLSVALPNMMPVCTVMKERSTTSGLLENE